MAKDHRSLRLKRTGKPSVRFALGRSTRVTGGGYKRATLTKGLVVQVTARKGKRGYSATKVVVTPPTSDSPPASDSPPLFYDGPGSGGEDELPPY